MNLGSLFRFQKKPTIDLAAEESANRIGYVDALLGMMLKKSQLTLRLNSSTPLPQVQNEYGFTELPPTFQAVTNRLKVMSKLNPVVYPAPVQGKIEITRGPHVLIYETHFDDKATPSTCLINLRVRQG